MSHLDYSSKNLVPRPLSSANAFEPPRTHVKEANGGLERPHLANMTDTQRRRESFVFLPDVLFGCAWSTSVHWDSVEGLPLTSASSTHFWRINEGGRVGPEREETRAVLYTGTTTADLQRRQLLVAHAALVDGLTILQQS